MSDVCDARPFNAPFEKWAEKLAEDNEIQNSDDRYSAGSKLLEEIANNPTVRASVHDGNEANLFLGLIGARADQISFCKKRSQI